MATFGEVDSGRLKGVWLFNTSKKIEKPSLGLRLLAA